MEEAGYGEEGLKVKDEDHVEVHAEDDAEDDDGGDDLDHQGREGKVPRRCMID